MRFKGILSIGMLGLLVLTGCSVADNNNYVNEENKQHLNISQAELIASATDNAKYLNQDILYNIETLEDTDTIGVIITLDNEGIADDYLNNSRGYSSLSTYATSKYAYYETSNMVKEQDYLASYLLKEGLIDEVNHSYTTLFNGFSASTTYGQFKKLEKLGIAKRVTISEVYAELEADSTSTSAIENVVDVYETGIFNSSGVGYTGDNTAVAILDSGFDVHHTVFRNMPNSPLISKSDVSSVLNQTIASSYFSGLKVEDVYYNSKIPFAYDYADKDSDVAPFDSNHGTHVAGIIGGNDDVITGVAINTQLVLMKVFGDVNNGARAEDILAALEDAVLLGVDAINMSLGTSCGFSRSSDNEYTNEVYEKIEAAGISVVVAASNDYSTGYGGAESNTNKASNPDSASVGSPGTYTTALSVASISGVKSKYITTKDGYVFFFNEANTAGTDSYDFFEMLGVTGNKNVELDYVTIPGVGKKVNYSNVDVKGKIALVKRGENSFADKAQAAYEAGAIACIIYNNVGGDIYMSAGNDLKIPLCSISKDDGEYLAKKSSGTVIINGENLAGPFISDFSSWGPTSDLCLKPEITAHGGSITSSVPGGGYDEISGTSMACPNLCGILILIRQYVKEKYPSLTAVEVNNLTNQLLMSTPTIALDKSGNPYSPRKQGSGLANLKNALNTLAYITVDGCDKTKIELGDDSNETGEYVLKFNVNNTSNNSLTYTLSNYTMSESLSTSNKEYVAEKAYMLSPTTSIKVEGATLVGDDIIVPANGVAKVEYTIKLNSEDKRYLRQSFENGMYVEGFVTLNSKNEDQIDLSVPFLAFFGDWTVAPMFDKTYYEVESEAHNAAIDEEDKIKADYYATTPLGTYYYSYIIPLGTYIYEMDKSKYDAIPATDEHAAIGYNFETINGITTVYAGLLRNSKKTTTTITNSVTGEVVFENIKYDQAKAHYSGGIIPAYNLINVSAAELGLENNCKYTFTMTAELDYGDGGKANNLNNTFSFSFYVDYEAPLITDAEFYAKYDKTLKENRYYVDVYIYDNHYVQSIRPFTLIDGKISTLSEYPIPVYSEQGEVNKVTIEITDYMDLLQYGSGTDGSFKLTNGLGFCVDDYALNQSYYFVNLPGTDSDTFKFVDESGKQITSLAVKVGQEVDLTKMIVSDDPTFNASDIGQAEYMSKLSWTSSNTNVLQIKNGKIEGISAGTAIVTAETIASNGYSYKVSLNVRVRATTTSTSTEMSFSNSVSLSNIEFTYFDTLKAFLDGPEISEIGETGDRIFFTHSPNISFYPSEQIKLGYEITPWNLDPSRYNLVWSSTNAEVASVDDNGVVTALKEGSSTIMLRIEVDGKLSNLIARARVTVKSEFIIENRVLVAYKGFGGDVVIPDDEGIMYIGVFAFSLYKTDYEMQITEEDYDKAKIPGSNNTITSVVIPYDVTEVRKYAFYNCTALEKVSFARGPKGDTCKIIGEHAFEGDVSLKDMDLKDIEVIGAYAFNGCTSLETVDFSKIYALGEQAFSNCTKLKEVDITTLRNAGPSVFLNCTALTTVINGQYTKFSANMFENSGLTALDFYADRIPDYSFVNCSNLKDVIIHNNIIYVGKNAFMDCNNLLNVTFKASCDFIYNNAFFNASSLNKVVLPNSNVEIESNAFDGCANLSIVEFNKNTYITETLGNTFANCTSLASFVADNSDFYTVYSSLLLTKDGKTIVLAAPNYQYGAYTISNNIEKIASGAFSGIDNITSLEIVNEVTIENYAFSDCKNLTTLKVTDGVNLGSYCFKNCTSLENIVNFDKLNYFAPYVFANTKLTSVNINENSTVFEGAFSNISSLEEVIIGNNITLEDLSFAYNSNLVNVVLGDNITILNNVFEQCINLKTINLDKVISIGNCAFLNCQSLESLELTSVLNVGSYAFADCFKIKTLSMPNVINIGDYAFSKITASAKFSNLISSLNLTDSVKSIGSNAFSYCTYLTTIEIGDSLKKIGSSAFENCTKLQSIKVKGSVETIEALTFSKDTELTSVDINNIKYIDDQAFSNCVKLESIDLSNVLQLGMQAFYNCQALVQLELPKAKKLAPGAFLLASNLTSISLPSVEYLGAQALSCTGLTTFEVANTISYVAPTAFYNNSKQESFKYFNGTELVQTASINDYAALKDGVLYIKTVNGKYVLSSYPTAKNSSTYEVMDGTVRIETYAAAHNLTLEYVALPDTLKLIGNMSFYGCNKLQTVEFRSTVAPTLEGTVSVSDVDYPTDSEIYKFINKYFQLNGYYPLFYGQFKNMVGLSSKINIVLPSNKGLSGYDNLIYSMFFDLDNKTISDYVALDNYSIDYLDKVVLVPTDVNISDENIILQARAAYNLVKQDLTKFGYEKDYLDSLYERLVAAEAVIKELKTERVNKVYEYLIEDIKNLGSEYKFEKISAYQSIVEALNLISKEDKKYIDTSNVDSFKAGYDAYFKALNEDVTLIQNVSSLPTTTVIRVGLSVISQIYSGIACCFAVAGKRWFI